MNSSEFMTPIRHKHGTFYDGTAALNSKLSVASQGKINKNRILMFIVRFQDGADWFKANWVFKQFAEDTTATFPNDTALKLLLEKAQALGGLFFDGMEADARTATLQAMRRVAEDTILGRIQGWKRTKPEDKEGQQMYLESINELLTSLKKHHRTS